MRAALQGNVMLKSDFEVIGSKEYGASYSAVSLAKELGLDKIIYSKPSEDWVKCSLAMIAGRLVWQGSKLALSNCTNISSIWEICGIKGEIDVNSNCYDVMDKLFARQDKIQKSLAEKHLEDGCLVLYDITSSYLEGEYEDSEIVAYGYNRDKKRGHKQIVISLLCNKEGCPVAVEVFEGNTKDESTVLHIIETVQNKYNITNLVFVGDRGMITTVQNEKIDHNTVKIISALKHSGIKGLLDDGIVQMSFFDEKSIVEVIEGEMRCCLCKNPLMAAKETATRKALLEKTANELDKIVKSTRKNENSKEVRIGKVINKYKMGKFVKLIGSGNDVQWSFDEEKIADEEQLDGCYVVYTDVSQEDMDAQEVVKNYKSLIKVENAFRNLKTAQLEIRPIYHKTDDRIKCHVFICMLAYYLMWHMNKRLQPLYESDGQGQNRKYTFKHILEILKTIRSNTVSIESQIATVISTPDEEQQRILSLLNVVV